MSKSLLTFLICLRLSLNVFGQITLEQCIDLATKNNPQTSLLGLVKESEILQINALNKNLLPQTSIGGQATWQSAVTSLNIKFPGVDVPVIPKDQYKTTIELSQTLWDGGQLKSQKQLAMASSKTEIRGIENNLYQTKEVISNLYFGILLAEKQYLNTETIKSDLESQLKKIDNNVANGTATKGNSLAIQAKLIELNQTEREIKSRKLAAIQGINILTGLTINESSILEQPINENNVVVMVDRPELKLFDAQSEYAEANKSLIKSKYMPRLNLFGTGGYGRPGLNFLSPNFTTYFIGGVNLRIPITQLYSKTKDIDYKIIDINKAKIEKQKETFLQQINLKLSSLKEEISKLKDQIDEDQKLIIIRSQIKKSTQNKLDNGIITMSEYLSEIDNETLAKQNLALHQIQLQQVYNTIKITQGN
jgi:outer membrane protein TolC